ncbi:MAG: Crp/Fnr family transcriptional regulator [Elusimicrobia bacterium]|nr:Crp/Fnr family transcriptional regulator [Elusimicrobiota bacterium]
MAFSRADILKFLTSIEPFRSLEKKDLETIADAVREKTFGKGETVFNEGETADSVWVLFKGRVQIFKYTSDGKPFAIEVLGPGELFGTLCRLGGNGRDYPCTAIASEKTSVFKILDRTFLEYYMKSPGFIRGVCSLCSERLKDVQDLRCQSQETVPYRLVTTLLRLYGVHGETIPFTKRELSQLIGATLETTFRELKELQKKGCLSSSWGKIVIKKPELLRKAADKL